MTQTPTASPDTDLRITPLIPPGIVETNAFRAPSTRACQVKLDCLRCGWTRTIDHEPRAVVLLQQTHFALVIRTGRENAYRCKNR